MIDVFDIARAMGLCVMIKVKCPLSSPTSSGTASRTSTAARGANHKVCVTPSDPYAALHRAAEPAVLAVRGVRRLEGDSMKVRRPSPLGWLLGLVVVMVAVLVAVLDMPGAQSWLLYWLFAILAIAALFVGTAISERRAP